MTSVTKWDSWKREGIELRRQRRPIAIHQVCPKMNLGVFVHHGDPALLSLISVLKMRGHRITVFAEREHGSDWFDHTWTFPILEQDPGVIVRPYSAETEDWEILFVGWTHGRPYTALQIEHLQRQTSAARRVVLCYDSQFGTRRQVLVQEIRMIRRHWRWLRHVRQVLYMHEFPVFDLARMLCIGRPMHIGPSVEAYYQPSLREALFASWEPAVERPVRLLWLGARGSSSLRQRLLGQLEQALNMESIGPPSARISVGGRVGITACWGASVPPQDYYQRLRETDFVLCLPGSSWTHRPYEGLVCGAIPILDAHYAKMHAVKWRDGQNCILVRDCRQADLWVEAIERAMGMTQSEIHAVREYVLQTMRPQLRFDAYFSELAAFLRI